MKQIDFNGTTKLKKDYQLIPIDHGLSFPDSFEIYTHELIWMEYSQAKQPFSDEVLKFIDNIEPVQDCKRLSEKLGFREICLRNFRIAQITLKKCARQGLTAYQIGSIVYRDDPIDSEV
jgi:hypothetical protein